MTFISTISESKKSLLNDFVILEENYKTQHGECRNISLHCKYDTNSKEFWNGPIDIYLVCEEVTEQVRMYIEKWGFKNTSILPKNNIFILGNYEMSVKYFNNYFIV